MEAKVVKIVNGRKQYAVKLDDVSELKNINLKFIKDIVQLDIKLDYGRTNLYNPQKINQDCVDTLSSFTNLTSLSIINQSGFTNLDVSKLKKLKYLYVIGNCDLETISGISGDSDLIELECFDCQNLKSVNQFKALLRDKISTMTEKGVSKIVLDVNMYPEFKKEFENFSTNKIFCEACSQKLRWGEMISGIYNKRYINEYSYCEMEQIYQKALDLVPQLKDDDNVYTAYNVLDWIRKNHSYDYKALVSKSESTEKGSTDRFHTSVVKIAEKDINLAKGLKMGTNGIKNAFLLGSAVCEGFAREFIFLCRVLGIDAQIQHVKDKNQKINGINDYYSDHSISRLKVGDEYFYCDPTFEIANYKQKQNGAYLYGVMDSSELSKNYYVFGGEECFREANRKNIKNLSKAEKQAGNHSGVESNLVL